MRTVEVNLGARSYKIYLASGILEQAGAIMRRFNLSKRLMIVTDAAVGGLYGEILRSVLQASGFEVLVREIPCGERSKSLATVELLYGEAISFGLERKSPVVALGGGVVGDVAGFVAATYLRGVPFIQIPTTLLAQVDSSVGGKVGINHELGKNLIGAFYQPKLVLIDCNTLTSLPKREMVAGLAEVVKYGVIWDKYFFEYLEENLRALQDRGDEVLARIVARSCEIKAAVVEQDENEDGLRAILNFGHTIGHSLEAVAGYGNYKHGEAIAIGMVLASRIAERIGKCTKAVGDRIAHLVGALGLPTELDLPKEAVPRIFETMGHDKKIRDGKIRFVLPEAIGKVVITDEVPVSVVEEALVQSSAAVAFEGKGC